MQVTAEHNERVAKLTFASVYPHYIKKVETKGRTIDELHEVIQWLTGFDQKKLRALIDEKATFETFLKKRSCIRMRNLSRERSVVTGSKKLRIRLRNK